MPFSSCFNCDSQPQSPEPSSLEDQNFREHIERVTAHLEHLEAGARKRANPPARRNSRDESFSDLIGPSVPAADRVPATKSVLVAERRTPVPASTHSGTHDSTTTGSSSSTSSTAASKAPSKVPSLEFPDEIAKAKEFNHKTCLYNDPGRPSSPTPTAHEVSFTESHPAPTGQAVAPPAINSMNVAVTNPLALPPPTIYRHAHMALAVGSGFSFTTQNGRPQTQGGNRAGEVAATVTNPSFTAKYGKPQTKINAWMHEAEEASGIRR